MKLIFVLVSAILLIGCSSSYDLLMESKDFKTPGLNEVKYGDTYDQVRFLCGEPRVFSRGSRPAEAVSHYRGQIIYQSEGQSIYIRWEYNQTTYIDTVMRNGSYQQRRTNYIEHVLFDLEPGRVCWKGIRIEESFRTLTKQPWEK